MLLSNSLRLSLRAGRFYSTAGNSTLVLIEHHEGKVLSDSLSAITAAQKFGGPVVAFVAGSNAASTANEVKKLEGVSKVVVANNAALDNGLAEVYAPVLINLFKSHNLNNLVAAHSNLGKNIFPRVAAMLDVSQLSDVMEIKSVDTFVRPLYAGNAIATLQTSEKTKIITIRPTSFPKAKAGSQEAQVEEYNGEIPKNETSKFLGATIVKSDRPQLASAQTIVSGGRSFKTKENFETLLYPLASKLKAAVGATRAAVEADICPNDLQIGQTGKIVAPELYIAIGISGAIQHLAGMKDAKVIAAINKDPEAPIFQVADVGLVADLFKVVPELTQKL
jgi:electron transfer flavoprotein alpha subunit